MRGSAARMGFDGLDVLSRIPGAVLVWAYSADADLTEAAKASQLLSSSGRRWLLVGGNSDQVAIERNGPSRWNLFHREPSRAKRSASEGVRARR